MKTVYTIQAKVTANSEGEAYILLAEKLDKSLDLAQVFEVVKGEKS